MVPADIMPANAALPDSMPSAASRLNKTELAGKHTRAVKGIILVTLLWTEGKMSKNDHFRMIRESKEGGFNPECVLFDSWYSGMDNLKIIWDLGWTWLTRLKMNRLLNPDGFGLVQINEVEIGTDGLTVHLKGYGFVKVFKIASKDGRIEHCVTNDLEMSETRRFEVF